MGQGWQVDVAGAQDVVARTAESGAAAQAAAVSVSAALADVTASLASTTASLAASAFADTHESDARRPAVLISDALVAAAGAMTAFAEGDAEMADAARAAQSSRERHG